MRVFIYEHMTGGGTLADAATATPAGSLWTEGAAMVRALAADFAAIPGVTISTLRDARLNPFPLDDSPLAHCEPRTVGDAQAHCLALQETAAESDATLLIAPESQGALQDCCRQVVAAGARLISPDERAVSAASDKLRLARLLAEAGIRVPLTRAVTAGESLPDDFPYPAVLKPVRGAGSVDIRLIHAPSEWPGAAASDGHDGWILQRFVGGKPVSVAFLCGRFGRHPLLPCGQRLSRDGRFRYDGGHLPLADHLAERAVRLADAAVAQVLPGVVGYVGVDLVLGDDADGAQDVVIEINPRVTTSYVGLRAATQENLAAAMLAAAHGEQPNVRFSSDPLQFDTDGTVRPMCESCPQ